MSEETSCVYHLRVAPGNVAAFRDLVARIVAATREEPGTLAYEYTANWDRGIVHIVERYRTETLLDHVERTFAPFAARFLELAVIEALYVYGATTPAIRDKLDGFGAVHMAFLEGFSR